MTFYDNSDALYLTEYSSTNRAWVVVKISHGKSENVAIGNTEREAMDNWRRDRLYEHQTKH